MVLSCALMSPSGQAIRKAGVPESSLHAGMQTLHFMWRVSDARDVPEAMILEHPGRLWISGGPVKRAWRFWCRVRECPVQVRFLDGMPKNLN
jgi:hypothetical protein